MHRGSNHHYGAYRDSNYSRRESDKMIELVQQFRDFKPYLKKRLAFIHESGRELELRAEIEDIEFYLDIMRDILADESHGVEQLKGFIDKIHEMIRKNPLTDLPSKRRSVDEEEHFGDNDRPRSPSPQARVSDGVIRDIPLNTSHGAHSTFDISFGTENDSQEDGYDEWGIPIRGAAFKRRENYNKDVDMRSSYCPSTGRGVRRWSGENDFGGARGAARGMGSGRGGGSRNEEYKDVDIRHSRSGGFGDSGRNNRNEWFQDMVGSHDAGVERERERGSNGNAFDDWQPTAERDAGFRSDDRRPRDPDWSRSQVKTRNQNDSREQEKLQNAQLIAKYFERRPSSESRRDEKNEDYISMFDRRSRNQAPPLSRSEVNRSPADYPHGAGHPNFRGRGVPEEDRHMRSRLDGGATYPHQSTVQPPGLNAMTGNPNKHLQGSMGYGPPPPRYARPGLLPPPSQTPYGGGNPPLLPHPPPHASNMGMHRPIRHPVPSGSGHPSGYPQPHSINNYSGRPDYRMPHGRYHNPPPPPFKSTALQANPPDYYHSTVPSGYASPNPPDSSEQAREIMMKAKQCFGRSQLTRPPTSSIPGQSSPGAATATSVSSGPISPPADSHSSNQTALDPRLNRVNRAGGFPVQGRHQSPPAPPAAPPTRSDAGNVLRMSSSDPRARKTELIDRKKLNEARERVIQHESFRPVQKPSKLQELRKKIEKEGLYMLGRRDPKKQTGTFEEALSSCDNDIEAPATTKPNDKTRSPSSSQSKEKGAGTGSRSHSDKTDKQKGSTKSPTKTKSKDKSGSVKGASVDAKKKKTNNKETKERSSRRKSDLNKPSENSVSNAKSGSDAIKNSSQGGPNQGTSANEKSTEQPSRPPVFKIPRKPKPKPVEPEKDVCTSPPASPDSPEPALSHMPASESRAEDSENASTSSSKSSSSASSARSSVTPEVNPFALEMLKQFLVTSSSDPGEVQSILSNPDSLKNFFFKIRSEITAVSAAQEKRGEDNNSNETPSSETDTDKIQSTDDSVPERGRSREKKRNTKRRSSLEKLHDALKEMRFDRMLPLGPRRCTRTGQDETSESGDTTDGSEQASVDQPVIPSSLGTPEESGKKPPIKKRGRPPKEVQAKGKKALPKAAQSTEPDGALDGDKESDAAIAPLLAVPAAAKRGRKRKLKAPKVTMKKRAKKSGPVTRAQAARKKTVHKEFAKNPDEATLKDQAKRKKKATNMILRRLTRNRIGEHDTPVNRRLGKIKLESDYIPPVKTEPEAEDKFLNSSNSADPNDDFHLLNFIDENLDNDTVANIDGQTEENMDLDVFNTLDAEDHVNDLDAIYVKDELDLSIEEEAPSDISYELLLNNSTNQATRTPAVASTAEASLNNVITETIGVASASAVVEESMDALSTVSETQAPDKEQETAPIIVSTSSVAWSPATQTSSSEPSKVAPLATSDEADLPTIAATANEGTSPNSPDSGDTTSSDTPSVSAPLTPEKQEDPLAIWESGHVKADTLEVEEFRKDTFKCEMCTFSGKKIVSHYVNKHYPCNIPQARLMPETFNGLIELNSSESPQLLEIVLDESQTPVWPCLYCDDRHESIVDFYDHLTSHTGEFRYECNECGISYPYHKSLINHVKQHKGLTKNCVRITLDGVINKSSKELSGFLCNDCYYFQLRFESITAHIDKSHHSRYDVKSVRLIRPSCNTSFYSSTPSTSSSSKSSTPVLLDPTVPQESEQGLRTVLEKKDGNPADAVVPQIKQEIEPVDEEEVKCVFYGTNTKFPAPTIGLNECTLIVPNVFEKNFLDSLLKRVSVDGKDSSSEESGQDQNAASRKRSRSESGEDEATGGQVEDNTESSNQNTTRTAKRTCRLKTTHTSRKKLKWSNTYQDDCEEPNDFLESSDEFSEESDTSDSSDDEEGGRNESTNPGNDVIEPTVEQPAAVDCLSLRNNEHQLKTRVLREDEESDIRYMEERNITVIRRPGDLHMPSTVIFGYIKPAAGKNSKKLRDEREADKLGGIAGRRQFPVKHFQRLADMMTTQKLIHLFKCMATYCSYTTDDPSDFMDHLNSRHFKTVQLHQSCSRFFKPSEVKMMKDADCCAYCSTRARDARDLVEHVINQHGRSSFQCNKCFYRSFYQRYVIRHFDTEHPGGTMQMLKCSRKVEIQYQEATLFQIFVYKCDVDNPACDKSRRFVFREDFMEHLKSCVPLRESYPCHLCKEEMPLEHLVEHYKIHNLFKFHCSYCQFGSEIKTDLDEHFVQVHPNTSGRVFHRVKPQDSVPDFVHSLPPGCTSPPKKTSHVTRRDLDGLHGAEKEQGSENQTGGDGSTMDAGEYDDNEKGRVTNLRGMDLYRCVTGDCLFLCSSSDSFKDHVSSCPCVAESRSLACAHCDRKMKTITNLLEHMRVHGEKKQVCSLCSFRCWTSNEITKHVKTVHRVMSYKLVRKECLEAGVDPDIWAFPKEIATKASCDVDTFAHNYYSLTRKAVYSFENIEKLPPSKIFSSDLFCAMCPYSTKVRSNIIRHLSIHKQALEDGKTVVPQAPRINPVPYLSREGLEFDKMMNLAASSHKTHGRPATEDDVRKLPQFVKEQFRYVCSVCDHITTDDALLQTHIKVIHSEVSLYQCPHCQKNPASRDNPDSTVTLDKIPHHLKLHGPKLLKCGHCMVVHHQLRLMEKHLPEKHPEKKPIHYLIRDVDPDGVPSSKTTISGANRRQSMEDPKSVSTEKWKCFLCSSKTIFGSWEDAKSHVENVHKVNSQFLCVICSFSSDDFTEMLTHCRETCTIDDRSKILFMFSKCEIFDDDAHVIGPVWKRSGGAVRHIHGNFTEDSVALIRHYNSQQGSSDLLPSALSSPIRHATSIGISMKSPMKPTTSTAKPRRSVSTTLSKTGTTKTVLNVLCPVSPPKLEVFKYRCHKCDMYKTKNPNELRVHLCNELRYKRWKCLTCSTTFTTEKSLKGHIERDHLEIYAPNLCELQPVNEEIESEINNCIEKQNRKRDMINSMSMEKMGKLACKKCDEEGFTYETFETHMLLKHSS